MRRSKNELHFSSIYEDKRIKGRREKKWGKTIMIHVKDKNVPKRLLKNPPITQCLPRFKRSIIYNFSVGENR